MSTTRERPVNDELISRRLYVGVGHYGSLVTETIRRRLGERPPACNQLTRTVDVTSGHGASPDATSRRAARAAFADSDRPAECFHELDDAVARCGRMPEMSDRKLRVDDCLTVFVVADLAESFAGAVLFDVARLAAAACQGRLKSIVGVFGLGIALETESDGPRIDRRAGYANVCAAMRELDHTLSAGLDKGFCYADPVPPVLRDRPFGQCLLLTEANRTGALGTLEEHVRLVSRFLVRHCRGDFLQQFVEFPHRVASPGSAPARPLYGSVGLSSVFFPRREAHAYCMERWALDVADALSLKQPDELTATLEAYEELASLLPDSTEALLRQVSHMSGPAPETSIPGGATETVHAATSLHLASVEDLAKYAETEVPPSMAEELLEQLAPRFEAKCRRRIDELVATGLSGIGSAEGCLCRLFDDATAAEQYAERPLLNRMLVETAIRMKSLSKALDRDLVSCRRRLQQILGAQPDRPLSALPFWFFHPLSFLQAWRLRKEREATLRDWQETVDGLCTQAEKLQAAKCTHRVLESLTMIVMRERGDLHDLTKKLHEVASAIGTAYRDRVPTPLSVDRPIVSSDCFERIYASAIDDAGLTDLNEALRRLVVDNRLLDGFRSASVAQLAARIEQEGRHFFDGVQQIGIDVLLGEGPYTRFVRSEGDAMAGLWELAEPLVDIGAAAMPEAWQPGEILAVWLPDPDHLVRYSPAQAAAQRNFHLNRGTPTSIHLCRVVHGFTMSSLARLKVYTPSYHALESKSELHIVDWESDLPPLL